MAVQQLREAGFSEDQQAALTTALLRVLALWTQQATREDLHAEHQAMEQHLAQQLDTLREDIRRAIAQHADRLSMTNPAPPRRRDVPLWLRTALLALTCAGVVFLVLLQVLGR
jgi:type VI protein secretion system component VasF